MHKPGYKETNIMKKKKSKKKKDGRFNMLYGTSLR